MRGNGVVEFGICELSIVGKNIADNTGKRGLICFKEITVIIIGLYTPWRL